MTRWRAFADAVAAALGLNVWVSLVLLPGLFASAEVGAAVLVGAFLPLLVLAGGIKWRSEALLLCGFPAALLFPIALVPELSTAQVYGPVRFALVAAGLVGYLLGASILTSFRESPPPLGVRLLSSASRPTPEHWRRRFRIYRGLAVLAIVFPLVLLYFVNFHAPHQVAVREAYPGRAAAVTALMNAGAIGLWLFLFAAAFLGALKPHRTGDRDLVAGLERMEQDRRPRAALYAGALGAFLLAIALLFFRNA